MRNETEIKQAGIKALHRELEMVEVEKFIALIQRDGIDYTKWRRNLFEGMSGRDISKLAMDFHNALE